MCWGGGGELSCDDVTDWLHPVVMLKSFQSETKKWFGSVSVSQKEKRKKSLNKNKHVSSRLQNTCSCVHVFVQNIHEHMWTWTHEHLYVNQDIMSPLPPELKLKYLRLKCCHLVVMTSSTVSLSRSDGGGPAHTLLTNPEWVSAVNHDLSAVFISSNNMNVSVSEIVWERRRSTLWQQCFCSSNISHKVRRLFFTRSHQIKVYSLNIKNYCLRSKDSTGGRLYILFYY